MRRRRVRRHSRPPPPPTARWPTLASVLASVPGPAVQLGLQHQAVVRLVRGPRHRQELAFADLDRGPGPPRGPQERRPLHAGEPGPTDPVVVGPQVGQAAGRPLDQVVLYPGRGVERGLGEALVSVGSVKPAQSSAAVSPVASARIESQGSPVRSADSSQTAFIPPGPVATSSSQALNTKMPYWCEPSMESNRSSGWSAYQALVYWWPSTSGEASSLPQVAEASQYQGSPSTAPDQSRIPNWTACMNS